MTIQTSSIVNAPSVQDALASYSQSVDLDPTPTPISRHPCDVATQTDRVTIDNRDPSWSIEILFVQIKCTSPAPPGYSTDTGVFVGASNQGPNSTTSLHPCRVGGRDKPIMGTWAEYAGKQTIVHNGKKYENTFKNQGQTPAGKFWRELRIQFVPKASDSELSPPSPPEVTFEFIE